MFSVQYGGECYGSATAEKTFDRYGKSDKCEGDGKGGTWANRVYAFQGLSLNLFTYFYSVSQLRYNQVF